MWHFVAAVAGFIIGGLVTGYRPAPSSGLIERLHLERVRQERRRWAR